MVLAALAFALLVEHLDPGSAAARRGAPTLGRRNSRTADSASKEPESDSGRSNDGGLEERDAEPSDMVRARLARVARASYRYVWRRVPHLLTPDVRGSPLFPAIYSQKGLIT